MSDRCCQSKGAELTKLKKHQTQVLWIVLFINLGMFVVEFGASIQAASLSLAGDSLDMLGDALVYASSLYVVNKGRKAQAGSAFFKGVLMFLFAIALFARATYQLFADITPTVTVMGTVGLLALFANLICLLLLSRHRKDNLNMSSVWLCSRNDIIANTSVLVAAGLVFITHSGLPDLAVGFMLTFVFAQSAGQVLRQSWQEMR